MKSGIIRIGPAGWSYKDWEGIVYPGKKWRGFDPLAYLAEYFDTIEVNSSQDRFAAERFPVGDIVAKHCRSYPKSELCTGQTGEKK